jgi:putative SOS response-associated peptidase YedK
MINARAESLLEKPAFKRSFERRRCIVPADGFYEWQHVGEKRRQPWFLGPHDDGALLAMAGLWSVWKDPDTGLWVPSATVVTTAANEDVARLHDRMPVLLPRDAWATWLDPDEQDQGLLLSLLAPAPDGILEMHPVSRRVNDVREDGPELVDPVPDDPAGPMPGGQGTLFD